MQMILLEQLVIFLLLIEVVDYAVEYAKEHKDTLVVVTTDHGK